MKAKIFLTALAISTTILLLNVTANETEEKIPDPGFRPESENAAAFRTAFKSAKVRVYPVIVRTFDQTAYSTNAQQQIVTYLSEQKMTTAIRDERTIDPGELNGRAQWEMFQNDLENIGKGVAELSLGVDYAMIVEFLIPPPRENKMMIFGIHCYLLNAKGENQFSFLLNSHHELFVKADLVTENTDEKSRDALIKKGTDVTLEALTQQLAKKPAPTDNQ